MKISLRAAASAAALTLATVGGVAAAGPATAATSSPQASCPSGYYCVYPFYNYGGTPYTYKDTNRSWRGYGSWHNDESSKNNGTSGMGVYLIGDGGRTLGCLPKGQGWTHHNPANRGEGNIWTWDC